jgi:hypothetical protein
LPSIHYALSERYNIVDELVRSVLRGVDTGCLLQNLSDNGKISFEVTTDSLRDVSEALKNSWLELVAKSSALIKRSA